MKLARIAIWYTLQWPIAIAWALLAWTIRATSRIEMSTVSSLRVRLSS